MVLTGYFKNEEKTNEVLQNGWLQSGDIVTVAPNGAITIVDRIKNIFKLSQGEYIAPEKLENVYVQSEYIQQIWVHGDSFKDYAVAFVVVDSDRVSKFAMEKEYGMSREDLLNDKDLIREVQDSIKMLAKENKFNNIEIPRKIKLLKDPFTVEKGLLTPTMKLKRNIAVDRFKDEIEALYQK